jgi:hypothetical protein
MTENINAKNNRLVDDLDLLRQSNQELAENLRQLCELLESIGHDCTPSREALEKQERKNNHEPQ